MSSNHNNNYYVLNMTESDTLDRSGSSYRYEDNAENNPVSEEEETPCRRRGSMSYMEEKERRASIKAILGDTSLTPTARRKSIQFLMDGRRNSLNTSYNPPQQTTTTTQLPQTVSPQNDFVSAPVSAGIVPICQPCQPTEQAKRSEMSRSKCDHYNRNCSIVAPCCGATFGCRFCHDDSPVLPPLLNQPEQSKRTETRPGGGRRKYQRSCSMPTSFASFAEPQHHNIDRFAIKEVICRKCFTRQSSKTNKCLNCDAKFGEYHCDVCNLWMDNDEKPYHCADCGFCRVGGAENFRHCHDCGMCIDDKLFDQHNCKVGKYMSNCPVCQEDLFCSRSPSHELPCGHAIHWHCFRELATHDSRCPVCKKTAETHERMLPTWNAMATGIELQPVPPDMAKVVTIICNDCEMGDIDRPWHFLGVQCIRCQSFNTAIEQITMTGPEAHAYLLRRSLQGDSNRNSDQRKNPSRNRRRSFHSTYDSSNPSF